MYIYAENIALPLEADHCVDDSVQRLCDVIVARAEPRLDGLERTRPTELSSSWTGDRFRWDVILPHCCTPESSIIRNPSEIRVIYCNGLENQFLLLLK